MESIEFCDILLMLLDDDLFWVTPQDTKDVDQL